ncbi:aldehyde dehydrogenase family protein [Streptomyces sp. NPDC002812]|uniref:aldehyde dehydrogenase family protein n=1 Tax=Streptomyces sp. NPDC002812 TaxID=3154434 RepID=UPI00331C6A56
MHSYEVWVNGVEEPGTRWVYWPRVGQLLREPFEVLGLKARLERGEDLPYDDRLLAGRVALSAPEQGLRALTAARAAQPGWAAVPLADRLELLHGIHRAVVERREELTGLLVAEGHPVRLAAWELDSVAASFHPDSVADFAARLREPERTSAGRRTRMVRKPDGVVCLSPPRNAPTSNSFYGALALAAGNSLVVNAPPTAPLGVSFVYRELVAPLLERLGAPPGTLNVVCTHARAVVRQWLDSPDCDDLVFFGGSEQGLKLERECVAAGKKPVLELSGNDGVLVWHDAEVDLAARALCERYYGSGQICMTPKFAIVHPEVADRLLKELTEQVREIRPGPPEDPRTVLSPVVKRAEFTEFVGEVLAAGGELLCGGEFVDVDDEPSAAGPFIRPAVVRVEGLAAAARLRAFREETFFPLLCVVVPEAPVRLEEAIGFLNANPYGLRNSLWTQDERVVERFCEEVVNGGMLKVNDSHIGCLPAIPYNGGTGATGGIFGEANLPAVRTTHLQSIAVATLVRPRESVFDHGAACGGEPTGPAACMG